MQYTILLTMAAKKRTTTAKTQGAKAKAATSKNPEIKASSKIKKGSKETKIGSLDKMSKAIRETVDASASKKSRISTTEAASSFGAPSKKMSFKAKAAIVVGFAAIVSILYLNRSLIVAATVNGEPIGRLEVVSEVEKRFGQQALDSIITERLVLQELRAKGQTVSDAEIQEEIKEVEERVKESGQDLDTLLSIQGMSREDLRKQIIVAKAAEKILSEKIKVTDQEISDYIKANQASLPKDKSEEENRKSVVDQLTQQKLSTEFNVLIEELRNKAKIEEFVKY